MAAYHGNSVNSEPTRMEQIITEFFAKSLHIILESRCPYVSSRNYGGEQVLSSPSPTSSSSSSSSFRPRDKWFNLALRDCPAALENIDFWRQSNLEPMIVDVFLVQRPRDWDPLNCSPKRMLVQNIWGKERHYHGSDNDDFGCEANNDKIIERWVLHYESKKTGANGGGSSSGSKRSTCTSSHALYKKSTLLLRSLYAIVRLLPASQLTSCFAILFHPHKFDCLMLATGFHLLWSHLPLRRRKICGILCSLQLILLVVGFASQLHIDHQYLI